MKVLLLGGSGQVGQALKYSAPAQWQVLTPTRDEVDFQNPVSISNYLSRHAPQLVINCAAYTAVDKAESEPALCAQINADACGYLAIAAGASNAVLIHISTDYVFDGTLQRPYHEDDTPAPLSVYGKTKWQGEQLVALHCPKHLIIRTSWIFDSVSNNFVNTMLRLGSGPQMLPSLGIVADQIGAPTPASSLARAIWQLAEQANTNDCPWGTYHFTGEPFVSWYEFATVIFSEAQRLNVIQASPELIPISAAKFGAKAPRPANSRLDCGKIHAAFGIKAADWRLELVRVLELKARGIK